MYSIYTRKLYAIAVKLNMLWHNTFKPLQTRFILIKKKKNLNRVQNFGALPSLFRADADMTLDANSHGDARKPTATLGKKKKKRRSLHAAETSQQSWNTSKDPTFWSENCEFQSLHDASKVLTHPLSKKKCLEKIFGIMYQIKHCQIILNRLSVGLLLKLFL